MENGSTSSPRPPHFFKPLLPGFLSHINIPNKFFSKYLRETRNEGNVVVKLISDASDIIWEVKMDGQKLTEGWQKFASSHDLRVGDILIFRYDGELLFHVTPFGPHCCEIVYNDDNDGDDDEYDDEDDNDDDGGDDEDEDDGDDEDDNDEDSDNADDDVIQIESDSDSEKYQHTREAGSSSDHSCVLLARVTEANLRSDLLQLPMDFSRSNGLTNVRCQIILLNEDGKPWRLLLGTHETRSRVYIKRGWKSFCCDNRRRVNDLLTFKLLQAGTTPVLQLCSSSSSTSQSASP